MTNLGAEDLAALVGIMAEEDRRPTFAQATALRNGLASDNALLRHFSARGLGRLEDPAALAVLGRTLTDPDAVVRLTAAGAIAQSVFNDDTETAAGLLRGRLDEEHEPAVRGALAQSLGRLRSASATTIEQTQTTLLDVAQWDAPLETLVPTLRGFESLVRTNTDIELAAGVRDRLVDFIRYGRGGANPTEAEQLELEAMFAAARVRRLALATLTAAGRANAETVEIALYDPDVEVRRLAAAAASGVDDLNRQRLLLQIALDDTEGQVRYEGLRGYGRLEHEPEDCATITTLVEDDDPNVALQAIDLLAEGCHEVNVAGPEISAPSVVNMLRMLVDPPVNVSRPVTWHPAAHALTTLAHVHPDAAEQLISVPIVNPIWQVRMYAARAAATIGAIDVLEQLAQDPFPNVADTALRGLDSMIGHAADGAAVEALNSEDYQRLITAADMLEATEHPDALAMLIEALERVTLEKKETSR
ncbi:MAG: HEAT repeat domain-containing protein, partial [Acidobacteriota bacterium]|nr:HEAT repeat domain-containing protein [Acidobacteriota bacterium]